MSISYPASRAMSAATAVYGVYALVRPTHLADVMGAEAGERHGYDNLARAYGVRDLVISAVGVFGPGRGVAWAMRTRMAGDLADCVTLVTKAHEGRVRGKVAAVTVGWAALSYLAYRWDRSRALSTGDPTKLRGKWPACRPTVKRVHVTFVRTGKRRYAVHVDRDQAADVVMDPAPGYDDHIPHDLVHLLVETHWGLRHGVYGLLAVGGDAHTFLDPVGSMRDRRRMKAKNRLSGSDVGRSELLAGLVEHAWRLSHGGARGPLSEDGAGRAEVDLEEVVAAAAALDRFARRWHALPVGGRLRVEWPWPERRRARPAS